MPCTTGRAEHVIIGAKCDCAAANPCCTATTAFSANPFDKRDERLSGNMLLGAEAARAEIAQFVGDAITGIPAPADTAELAAAICGFTGATLPFLACSVLVSVTDGADGTTATPVVTISQGQCIASEAVVLTGSQELLFDGLVADSPLSVTFA